MMNTTEAKTILDKVVGQVFGYQNPLTLEQAMQKFAFDVPLPQQVHDVDGSLTWAQSLNGSKFLKIETARARQTGIMPPKPLNDLQDVLAAWNEINYITTERAFESINVAESDNIDNSENVFRSQDIRSSKNIVFSNNLNNSEFLVSCNGGRNNAFCIRMTDSNNVANSFEVSWSTKITNCMFIHDCSDMQDSMFCTGMKGGRFCIANMQFEEAEYRRLRDVVIRWILTDKV